MVHFDQVTKSDILECIKTATGQAVPAKLATVVVLDMVAVVHMDWPTKATTFTEYVTKQMKPYLESQITPTVACIDGAKLLLSTKSESVISNRPCDVSALQSCNHSEADSRIFLHLGHAVSQGHQKTYVWTVNSDAPFCHAWFL